MRRRAKPAKAKVEAKLPLEKRLAEALEQQTATSEILRIISTSPTDLQPVFETIVRSASRLCDGQWAIAVRFDGELLHLAAQHSARPGLAGVPEELFPRRPGRELSTARAVLDGELVHIPDAEMDPDFARDAAQRQLARSFLAVPMIQGGVTLGAIGVSRSTPGPFAASQIALVKTFADQAAIAIENVRLFTELQERNREVTATAEVLRVISSSPTDVEPVFESIVRSAARVCEAADATLSVVEGREYRIGAHYGPIPLRPVGTRFPIGLGTVMGKSILEGRALHVEDLSTAEDFPEGRALARELGQRTTLCVPLLREGAAIGTIMLRRTEARRFSDKQVTLLTTFADQAVIAIENVRLFTELQGRNREVTEALEQQTATSEILRVISSSPTNVQPVFDTILANALRFCEAHNGGIFTFDGQGFRMAATAELSDEFLAYLREAVILPGSETPLRRVGLEPRASHVADILADPSFSPPEVYRREGMRTSLAVPMLREGRLVGALAFHRRHVQPFTEKQIALITTFADQAVIAIENVRLFNELQARTEQLTRSVDKLTALGEVSRALSSTLDLEAVLQTIVSRASQLARADGCSIYEYQEGAEEFQVRATHNFDASFVEALRAMPLRKGEGAMGRATETREPLQVADIAVPGTYQSRVRDVLIGAGYRAVISVPMLLEEQIIGSLSLVRKAPGEFPGEVVELLKNFATQSALAIQNARLFREIADKSQQLEAASQHKSEFLANMSHELRTPLNAIIGFSEVLSEGMFGEINEKQTEYLGDILDSGRHLLSLINDILDLSKIEAGRMELEPADFDLPGAIENALILVRERASRRGIGLGRTIDPHLGTIRADERKVKQVLLNLLSNALKFTSEGGRIDVSANAHDDLAEIAVSDTGVGIAPEDQEAVFEEFRQVGTAQKKVEGTGLGLALSRKFIELHGGKIWVQSEVGRGSTFTFTLPLRR